MSTVSGLASKGEKGSKKFSALNINNLYKGKSLENPKTTVAPKHGLQTLGKVGAGRRIPPPANFPTLKSENAGNNPCINLVPSGGQGWLKDKDDSVCSMPVSSNSSTQQRIPSPKLASEATPVTATATSTVSTLVASNANVVATGAASASAASKTWSSVTCQEDVGQEKSFLAHQSPFFPQEFPKLDGGVVREEDSQKQSADCSYGPGPSLRPQTEGSWTRGTAPQYPGNQPVNNGSGVNGQSEVDMSAVIPPVARAYQPQMVGVQQIPLMNASAMPRAPNLIPTGHAPPIMPLSPQYRPMVSPYIYNRNTGFPQGYPPPAQMPNYPAGAAVPPRPPYQYERMRQQQQIRTDEDGTYPRPTAPILTDKDLKGFDEILESESYDDWALANTEIDYNAKLVFSDDEENGVSKKEYKNERNKREEKPNELKRERSKSERDSSERESDKDDKRYRPPQQWQTQVSRQYDYRGASSGPQQFSGSSGNYPSLRNRSDLADEDEMWRLRSRQHSDEMTAAVARARQRREEEEKKFEQSRQAAQEKAKALEEKARNSAEKEKDNTDSDDRSSLSRESRDDKQSNKDFRAANYNSNFSNKQFPKNMPPRFQKLQQQQQQMQQQPISNSVQHFGNNRYELVSSQRGTQFDQNSSYGYYDPKRVDGDSGDTENQRHDRPKHLEDNWRTQNDINSRITEKVSESPRNDKLSTEDTVSQIRVQNRRVLQREDHRGVDGSYSGIQRSDSRNSFSSREEKQHAFERQESSQSSQSDKRSTSSRDDKAKKCERLDWASECDNVSIASSNSSTHFGSTKRERHRPVPVIEKHLSVNEPIKTNLTTLKKDDTRRNASDIEIKKPEERIIPSSTVTELDVVKDSVKVAFSKCDSKESLPKFSTETKRGEQERKDSSKKFGRDKATDRTTKCETSQERKLIKSDDNTGHVKEREAIYDKDFNYRQTFRGKEYRRSRGAGDRPKQDNVDRKGQRLLPRKLSKSRRHTQRSDDSLASEEMKKEKENESQRSTFDSLKNENERHRQNTNSSTLYRDESKKGRGAFKNSRGRPYGISNYGPPPSKAAFEQRTFDRETKNVSRKSDFSETKTEKRSDFSKSSSKDATNGETHLRKNYPDRSQKDSYIRRATDNVDITSNRDENAVPPRFQKKQGSYRGGKGNKQSGPGKLERMRRQRTSSNQESSDIGNDEWETESEISDIERRDGRRNDRIQHQNRKPEGKSHRRHDKRKDTQKGPQQPPHRGQSNRSNRGTASPNEHDSQSAAKNGPATTVLAVSDVIMDNPQAVGDAIADLKERQKSSNRKNQVMAPLTSDVEEGFQKVSYKKRFKSNTASDELKKQKNEVTTAATSKLNARNRFTSGRHLPPRLAKQKETGNKTSFGDELVDANIKENDVIKEAVEDIEGFSRVHKEVREKSVEQTVNAWTKPLSHAIQGASSTVVTTVACSTKPSVKTITHQQTLGISSKSSSFDHQDSGIDVSDQPASTASSQRSSPSNDDNTKPVTTTAKPTATPNVITTSMESDDLDARKPVTTIIFQNTKLKEQNDVLDNIGKPQDKKLETTPKKQFLANEETSSKTAPSLSTECSAKDTFRKLEEEESNSKLGFHIKEEKSSVQPVNKAVGTPRNADVLKSNPISTSADELNQHLKIASVKKVWETPSGLDTNVEECVVSESLNYDNQKAKQSAISSEPSSSTGNNTSAMVTGQTWGTVRHVPFTNQDMNKVKANPAYSQVINSQLGPQSLLFPSSQPTLGTALTSHLDGFRQMQNYQMAGLPPISSPPNLIYNTQPQMTGPALSFAQQMKNFPQVMAQIAAATPATAYHQHQNITLMPHQNNTLSQANIYMPSPNQSVNQPIADRYRINAAHQSLASQHLMKSQFTVQASAPQAGLHRIPVATSTAFYSNQAQPGYFQQTNVAGSTLQQQQAYGYATPQQQLLTATTSQVNPQQSYRNVSVAIGRTDSSTMRSPNGKYNNYR